MAQGKGRTSEFLETCDVARLRGVTTATVRHDVALGRLLVAACTRRGTNLFYPDDVARYLEARPPRAHVMVPARRRSAGGPRRG